MGGRGGGSQKKEPAKTGESGGEGGWEGREGPDRGIPFF